MTLHWKAEEQYFTAVLFAFQFYPVCHFGKCVNFGPGTVRSEWVKLCHSINEACVRWRNIGVVYWITEMSIDQ